MSNIVAGSIFEQIIDEVVQASQTDFEENGVNQQTLLELRQTWQQKLSVRNVAQMPWDPKPEPTPQPPANALPPSSATISDPSYAAASQQSQASNGPRVKNEPVTEQPYNGNTYVPQPMNPELAQQRAASLLHQQYGSQATASLDAMQRGGIALPGQPPQQKPTGLQLPGQNPQALQQQYAQQLKQQQAAQQPRIKAETDGAADDYQIPKRQRLAYAQANAGDHVMMDDWNAMMTERGAITEDQIARNDALMRQNLNLVAGGLESGLMQPLDGAKKRSKRSRKSGPRLAGIPQLDGDFSDDGKDEDDENAINSDLDSSGDEANNADEDDDEIDQMLCTYDKVQRVKNKWKCTLKDGVLAANGKEYLFHKAQGEFEW